MQIYSIHLRYASSDVSTMMVANRSLFSSIFNACCATGQEVIPPCFQLNSKMSSPLVPGSVVRNMASGNVEKNVVFTNLYSP